MIINIEPVSGRQFVAKPIDIKSLEKSQCLGNVCSSYLRLVEEKLNGKLLGID
ncbi:hypothetical protein [Lactococcus petauri]|uniref:hypothetical protein n=1 Tax=Lactococcus petauri TaxID=1940789 RepID=UPI001302D3F0|nr:hypothetical protein [Lactococcus petauri]